MSEKTFAIIIFNFKTNAVQLDFLFIKESWKKIKTWFLQKLNNTTVFNINYTNKGVKHQISILEWFMKYHVTLKSYGSWKFSFPSQEYILKSIQTENSYF